MVQPNNLFQVTVSPKTHVGNVSALVSIRSNLLEKDGSKHRMIFVVSHEHLETFPYQDNLEGIDQFVTTIDTATSESVVHPSKKAKTKKSA